MKLKQQHLLLKPQQPQLLPQLLLQKHRLLLKMQRQHNLILLAFIRLESQLDLASLIQLAL